MNLAHEDDGIIDLRALKSVPPPPGSFAPLGGFGGFGASFASEPPPAAFTRDHDAASAHPSIADGVVPRSSRAKTIGIAAGAGLFLILGAVGIGFAFRGAAPAKVASAAAVQAPAPVVAPAPSPAADPAAPAAAAANAPNAANAASASDDASNADAANASTSTKKSKGTKGRAGAKAKASTSVSASAASKPAAAAKSSAADPCHCHGDFQCNIRCSANR